MLPIMEIENGIIEQIAAAKLPYLRLVSSYGGELMGDWQGVIRALPAVWVTFKDSTAPEPLNTARHAQGRAGQCGYVSDARRCGPAHLHAGLRA